MKISILKTQHPKQKPPSSSLGFGQYFSDHMFMLDYNSKNGWHNARIVPYAPIAMDPAASVLHYGQALFEGMKTFIQDSGRVVLFRPHFNFERIQNGAHRLCMQAPPIDLQLQGLVELLKIDQDWIPADPGCSLYIRPTLIGTEGFLGVRPSESYLYYIILSPVASYYKEGLSPVKIWVEEEYTRAAKGGLGAIKAGANYAASLLAAERAKKNGYSQVLWLDAAEKKILEEVGTMNVFFVINDQVVTPKLDGTILPGGVRDSVITLLKSWNIPVIEKEISIDEILEANKSGTLKEAFGTGTAAVISPMGELFYKGTKNTINNFNMGQLSQRLYNEITGLQKGRINDLHQWIFEVK